MRVAELINALQDFLDTHGNLEVRLQDDDCGMWPLDHIEKRAIVNVFKPECFDACGLMIPPEEWTEGPSATIHGKDPSLVKLTIEGKEIKIKSATIFGPYGDDQNYSIDILAEKESIDGKENQ